MAIARKMSAFAEKSSWIRKMFEQGTRMKAEFGADNVFDFSLGNPDGITYGLLGLSFLNTGDSLSAEAAYRNAIVFAPETNDWKLGLARALLLGDA